MISRCRLRQSATALTCGFLLFSCAEGQPKDYHDRLIDFAIENRAGTFLELPDLYDGNERPRPDFENDKIILAEKLRARGFKAGIARLSTLPLEGQQMVTQKWVGENCECEIVKTYRVTPLISKYAVSEKIKCR